MTQTNGNNGHIFEFGKFVLDPNERILLADGEPVHLTDKVFDTLYILVRNNGRLLSKEQMMTSIWEESFVEEGNLAKNISRLRKILNADDAAIIETIPRRGYRFTSDVRELDGQTSLLVRRNLRVKITQTLDEGVETTFEDGNVIAAHDPELLTQPSRRRGSWKLAVATVVIFVAASGALVGYSVWPDDSGRASIDAGPVRLTDGPKHENNPVWTKDGRIRFIRRASGETAESVVMEADGSDQTVVKISPSFAFGHWSPDQTKVIFGKPNEKGRMYLANEDGSNELPLPAGGNHDWSADGKKIVYQAKSEANDDDIFIYTLEGGGIENVTRAPSFDADPSFSPDGKQIVFVSTRDGNAEIYLMNVDGANVRRLTNHPAWENHPVFSPDGTAIAFNGDRENENSDILVMNVDGTGLRKMIDWPSDETIGPGGWSPDGTKIAFYSHKNGNDDIYVASAEVFQPRLVLANDKDDLWFPSYSSDGSKILYQALPPDKTGEIRIFDVETERSETVIATESNDLQPRFSPDGERIVYQNKVGSDTEIYCIRKDGAEVQNLTQNAGKDTSPSFSWDGKQIAFTSNRGRNSGANLLYTMNSDGSDQRLAYPANGIGFAPAWSPDSTRLIFAYDNTGLGNFEIFTVRPGEEGTERQLTFFRRFDGQPAFSPDGSKIVFVTNEDGNWEIYLMNSDGTGRLRLTRNAADDSTPQFSPDGSRIIFSSKRDGKLAIYTIDLSA